jgi:zinc transporter 1/2/3
MLTGLNVACWLLPLRAKNFAENKTLLSLANAFSGGVFLSLAFGHLIPECVHGFNDLEGSHNEVLPFMTVLFGYLLIFFVEKVAFDAHGLMHVEEEPALPQGQGEASPNSSEPELTAPAAVPVEEKKLGAHAHPSKTARSAVILLGALAIHSILEMTALGLADSFSDSALLSVSIALHQPAESIALLVAFLKSGMPKPEIFKLLSVFSLMGPVGVALGMAVKSVAPPLVDCLMLATVAGTFIYVGATEVIPEEWEDGERRWTKFGSLMAGIVGIFAITQYTASIEHAHH